MKKQLLFTFLIIILSGCQKPVSNLEKALVLAGDNRSEVEKILAYYSQKPEDSLKYRAACYLIENMPGHISYNDSLYYRNYYDDIDSVADVYKSLSVEAKDSFFIGIMNKHRDRPLETIEDIKIISAEYLISNIEKAFSVWRGSDWATHIDFDLFCEYILPYKTVELQELDGWRDYFEFRFDDDLRQLEYCDLFRNSSYRACQKVNEGIRSEVTARNIHEYGFFVRKMSTLAKVPFGVCDDYNVLAISVMRAKGIPCVLDFTPQWPFRSLGHSWGALMKNSGKHAVFSGGSGRPGDPHKEDHKMAKVFRHAYAINPEIYDIHNSQKYIPTTFQSASIKDVTEEYMETVDIGIRKSAASKDKYAYLAVFDNRNWVPIHWGKVKNRDIIFEKMGKDIVYLPVYFGQEGIIPFSDPILLTITGDMITLTADTLTKRTLTLWRKYPAFHSVYKVGKRVLGGRIEAANNPGFNNADTIHVIDEYGIMAREIKLDMIDSQYRYWRYYSPDGGFCNIAEMYFFKKGATEDTVGRIIGTDGSLGTGDTFSKKAVFDRDALTFFDAPQRNDCWVGMDFGEPINIEKIIYIPRSDGNTIEIGDDYELFYWESHQWRTLGRKIAKGVTITFDNCPGNALFLLHNHTKGKEERIFTYEDNKQVWW